MKILSLLIYLGGGSSSTLPRHTETNKLRGSIKKQEGNSIPPIPPPPRQFTPCILCSFVDGNDNGKLKEKCETIENSN